MATKLNDVFPFAIRRQRLVNYNNDIIYRTPAGGCESFPSCPNTAAVSAPPLRQSGRVPYRGWASRTGYT